MPQKVFHTQPFNNKLNFLQVTLIALTVLGFEAISFLSSNYGDNSSNISIAYRVVYLIITLIVIKKYWIAGRTVVINNSIKIIFIFWGFYLVKGYYDTVFVQQTIQELIPRFWEYGFLLCFVPIFSFIISVNRKTLDYARMAVFALAIFVNIFSLINNIKLASQSSLLRLNANEILNSITYGQTGVILIIMSFTSVMKQSLRFKYLYILLIGLGLANIGLASSRGPVIELFFVVIFFVMINLKKIKSTLFVIFLLAITVGIYFSNYLFIFNSVVDRIKTTSGNEERPVLYKESWQLFTTNPYFGSNAIGEYAHNIFLGSLEALGILGGLLILAIYYNALKESIALVKIESTNWVALLLVMQLIGSLLSGAIWNGFLFWAFLPFVSNLYYNRRLYV